jgi:hypothetical protein
MCFSWHYMISNLERIAVHSAGQVQGRMALAIERVNFGTKFQQHRHEMRRREMQRFTFDPLFDLAPFSREDTLVSTFGS